LQTFNDIAFSVEGKYFDEISQDSGRYCFGVQETLKALEMGAVEILIVWENLEIQRYTLKNNSTNGKCTSCMLLK
jgi:peptide chain release factor subunit 1